LFILVIEIYDDVRMAVREFVNIMLLI